MTTSANVIGAFANVTSGLYTDAAGDMFRVSYGDSDPDAAGGRTAGNDVSLTFVGVPEPSTWVLLGSGAAGVGLVALRRRQTLS